MAFPRKASVQLTPVLRQLVSSDIQNQTMRANPEWLGLGGNIEQMAVCS